MVRLAALILLLAALAGCGETSVREEPSITVTGGKAQRDEAPGVPAGEDAPRIAVVTHGQASSPFWAIVRTGVEAAQRQMNVQVDYEAPDVYSLSRMIELVDVTRGFETYMSAMKRLDEIVQRAINDIGRVG